MLKLILLIIIIQIISNDASPFPDDMYHGKKLTILQNFLRTQGLQTTPIERYKQLVPLPMYRREKQKYTPAY